MISSNDVHDTRLLLMDLYRGKKVSSELIHLIYTFSYYLMKVAFNMKELEQENLRLRKELFQLTDDVE